MFLFRIYPGPISGDVPDRADFFFYIKALIRDGRSRGLWESLHFLPALLCLLIMAPFYVKDAEYKIQYIETAVQNSKLEFNILFFLAYVQVVLYFLEANRLIRGYIARFKQTYSDLEPVSLDWIRNLSGIILVICLFCLPLFGLLFLGHDSGHAIDYSFLIALTLYFGILFLGYRVWIQPDLVSPSGPFEKKEKYLKSKLSREESKKYYSQLIDLMEKEKVYLEPNLNLPDLAKRMDLNPRYLSQVINENACMNFYDFVNQFRVEEAKKAILDPQNAHQDILTIAFDAGFSSKATFNTLFKKNTKLTPSQYRKSNTFERIRSNE